MKKAIAWIPMEINEANGNERFFMSPRLVKLHTC